MTSEARKWDMADIHTPLLHEHWYVAGYADEFDEGLHERTFLERSIVIYRTEGGDLVALQNRCAHRSFPLAQGWREGDDIRCRYHGAKYNSRGEMIEIPSMAACPRVTLRRYPMQVSGPLAWIWMGDPENQKPLPDTSWLGAGWTYVTGYYPLNGNWVLMAENLMDLTHIPFLHASTFEFPKGYAQARVKMEIQGDTVYYYRENPPGYQRAGFLPPEISEQLEKAGFHARSAVLFASPALSVGGATFVVENPALADQPEYRWQNAHFTTPKSQRETYYWFFNSRNYALEDAALSDKIRDLVVAGFKEDQIAIEYIQQMHENDTHPYREVQFKSDAPAVAMRRIVAAMARKEKEAPVTTTSEFKSEPIVEAQPAE